MGKTPCCDKINVKKGPWSPEEDAKLKAYVEKHGIGGNWIALPRKIGLKRCGKSCRLRWLNYLRPDIRHGDFTEEEDNLISRLYITIGSRWSIIAAQLPGRTDNDVKNYWNTKLKKKLLGTSKESQASGRSSSIQESMKSANCDGLPEGLSASALLRIQLHLQLHGSQSSFSLLNDPSVWHTLQRLGHRALPMHQNSSNSATALSSASESGPSRTDSEKFVGFMIDNTVEQIESNSTNGSSLSTSMTFNTNLSSFGEADADRGTALCWAGNRQEEQPSPSSWDSKSASMQLDFMFQESFLGYDF